MSEALVRVDIRGGVANVTLNHPARANALSSEMLDQLDGALDETVRLGSSALVLRSSGSTFCSGFDLSTVTDSSDSELASAFVRTEEVLQRFRGAPAMTIAVVAGPAIGAGADLAAACDYRLGTTNARFNFPGIRFGLLLGTAHLAGLVGAGNLLDILIRGMHLPAEKALALGLLSELHSAAEIENAVDDLCVSAVSLDRGALRGVLSISRGVERRSSLETLRDSIESSGIGERLTSYLSSVKR